MNKSTGAQFALMPRNVVSGEFTKVVQRVPVRIAIEKDDRWSRLRAGLSARVAIPHGPGDTAWAEQAARQIAGLEGRFNRLAESPSASPGPSPTSPDGGLQRRPAPPCRPQGLPRPLPPSTSVILS